MGQSGSLQHFHFVGHTISHAVRGHLQVVMPLKIHPKTLGRAEVPCKPEGGVGGHRPIAVNDLVDTASP